MESNREKILRGTIQGVAEHGLEGLNMKMVSKLSGCNSSTIYIIFNGKEDLLRCCFVKIDRQIARLFAKVSLDPLAVAEDPEGEIRRIWTRYFRFLINHPAETMFYIRYRNSSGFAEYDKTRDVSHYAAFVQMVRAFNEEYQTIRSYPPNLLWLHLLVTPLMYAKYVVEGVLPRDAATQEFIFQLEMNGLRSLLAEGGTGGHGKHTAKGDERNAGAKPRSAEQSKPA